MSPCIVFRDYLTRGRRGGDCESLQDDLGLWPELVCHTGVLLLGIIVVAIAKSGELIVEWSLGTFRVVSAPLRPRLAAGKEHACLQSLRLVYERSFLGLGGPSGWGNL